MGFIDWMILISLLLAIWHGLRRGMVGMLLNLGGVLAVFFLIGHYFPVVKGALIHKFGFNEIMAWIIGLLLLIVIVYLINRILRALIERSMMMLNITFINRFLGAILGFIFGMVIVIIFSLIIDFIPSARNRLKDGNAHRVYSAVEVVKHEAVTRWGLDAKTRLHQYAEQKVEE
ncbi:MAG: CvpA family protein [Candidatus Cloacimonetes bacterium]|nr:CvpA family protein [Candidatus Cloacimonadota bacterium]